MAESTWEHSASLPSSLVSEYEFYVMLKSNLIILEARLSVFLNSVYQKNESMEPCSKRICLEKMLNQPILGM